MPRSSLPPTRPGRAERAAVPPSARGSILPLLAVLALVYATPTLAQVAVTATGRGGGPPAGAEAQLVERFDRNSDGRLDRAERDAARTWLTDYRGGGSVGGRGSAGLAPTSPGERLSPRDVPSFGEQPLYDPLTLRTIFLDFESADWEQELAAFYDTDVDVPALVTVDGKRYPDVGARFRGATSFLGVPDGSKRSFNLAFDFVHEDQRLGGYRTLNLLNGHNDPTFVRGALYSEIARRYIAAPKVSFVRVVINGESWGVYANAEQFNKDFLRDFFDETEGGRWKVEGRQSGRAGLEYLGEDVEAYRRFYEIRSEDEPESWADLIRLTRVLEQTPPELLEAELAPLLDVDAALRFLALEVALVNADGYWARASDYNLYQDPLGRFHVIPHDINEALGAETFGVNDGPRLDPLVGLDDPSRPLRSKLLAVPALRERYLGYVRDVAERWLDPAVFAPMSEGFRELIDDDVRRDTRKLYPREAFDAGFADLERFAEQRRAFLLGWRPPPSRGRDSAAPGPAMMDRAAGQEGNSGTRRCVTSRRDAAASLVPSRPAPHLQRSCS